MRKVPLDPDHYVGSRRSRCELDRPLEGLIKVSDAPLRNALQHLNQ